MKKNILPDEFVVLAKKVPQLIIDLKYCGDDNLIGRPLEGYASNGSAVLTIEAAESLQKMLAYLKQPAVKSTLKMTDPTLVIWDAYRPQMGCEDFWQWSQSSCEKTKKDYYPNIDKKDFFKLGYIARKSSHSRGSTIDLNIVDTVDGRALEMGTRFDFMDPLSHPDNRDVAPLIYQNRQFLKKFMNDFDWLGIDQEWWHFTFTLEPFPETYFNFPVVNYEE